MLTVSMPEMRTQKGFLIEAGWIAQVPQFRADQDYEDQLTKRLIPGYPTASQALNDAKTRIDRLGRCEYMARLRDAIKRYADDYARKWPHLVTSEKTLKGFDPTRLAVVFVPYEVQNGRAGRPELRNLLREMAKEAA